MESNGEFVVIFPLLEDVELLQFVGVKSGKNIDKESIIEEKRILTDDKRCRIYCTCLSVVELDNEFLFIDGEVVSKINMPVRDIWISLEKYSTYCHREIAPEVVY